MRTFRRAGLTALFAVAAALHAAEPALDPGYESVRQVAESGRFEHTLRLLDLHLVDYPEDDRLRELRARMVEKLAEAKDDPTLLRSTAEPPPAIANRVAEPGRNFTTGTAEVPMIWIAPGTFFMSDPLGSDDDTWVTLSRGYWLGRTEVTQEQWQAVMENLPSPSFFRGSDRPVDRVSWTSAMEFCRKVTERERAAGRVPAGYEYTLPTEAQWEYACRAGTTGPFAGELAAMAWFGANSDKQTHPVAQKQPNAWGLYDMHGNVAEWCADGYGGYPGGHVTDPINAYDGPAAAMTRIVRGGAFNATVGECRSAMRYRYMMSYAMAGVGFRLALAPVVSVLAAANSAGK